MDLHPFGKRGLASGSSADVGLAVDRMLHEKKARSVLYGRRGKLKAARPYLAAAAAALT